jgi:hypothetical protein
MRIFEPGEAVALREVWRGRVFGARPATVVRDTPDLQIFYKGPRGVVQVPVDASGVELRMPAGEWQLQETRSSARRVLSFAFPDTAYVVLMLWDEVTGRFEGWYVNIESAPTRTPLGFDTEEHLLDVVIAPDRQRWKWKDQDELAEAVELGLFTPDDAFWFHHWGERGVEHVLLRQPPFDEDWQAWQPDPAWIDPSLPADWDRMPAMA